MWRRQETVKPQLVKNDPVLGWKSPGLLVREGADVMEEVITDKVKPDAIFSSSRLWSTASKYVLSPCSTVMATVVIPLVVLYLAIVFISNSGNLPISMHAGTNSHCSYRHVLLFCVCILCLFL